MHPGETVSPGVSTRGARSAAIGRGLAVGSSFLSSTRQLRAHITHEGELGRVKGKHFQVFSLEIGFRPEHVLREAGLAGVTLLSGSARPCPGHTGRWGGFVSDRSWHPVPAKAGPSDVRQGRAQRPRLTGPLPAAQWVVCPPPANALPFVFPPSTV